MKEKPIHEFPNYLEKNIAIFLFNHNNNSYYLSNLGRHWIIDRIAGINCENGFCRCDSFEEGRIPVRTEYLKHKDGYEKALEEAEKYLAIQ